MSSASGIHSDSASTCSERIPAATMLGESKNWDSCSRSILAFSFHTSAKACGSCSTIRLRSFGVGTPPSATTSETVRGEKSVETDGEEASTTSMSPCSNGLAPSDSGLEAEFPSETSAEEPDRATASIVSLESDGAADVVSPTSIATNSGSAVGTVAEGTDGSKRALTH